MRDSSPVPVRPLVSSPASPRAMQVALSPTAPVAPKPPLFHSQAEASEPADEPSAAPPPPPPSGVHDVTLGGATVRLCTVTTAAKQPEPRAIHPCRNLARKIVVFCILRAVLYTALWLGVGAGSFIAFLYLPMMGGLYPMLIFPISIVTAGFGFWGSVAIGAALPSSENISVILKISELLQNMSQDNERTHALLLRAQAALRQAKTSHITPELVACLVANPEFETEIFAALEKLSKADSQDDHYRSNQAIVQKGLALITAHPAQTQEILKHTLALTSRGPFLSSVRGALPQFYDFYIAQAFNSPTDLNQAANFIIFFNTLSQSWGTTNHPLYGVRAITPPLAQAVLLGLYCFKPRNSKPGSAEALADAERANARTTLAKAYLATWPRFPLNDALVAKTRAKLFLDDEDMPTVDALMGDFLVLPSIDGTSGTILTPERVCELIGVAAEAPKMTDCAAIGAQLMFPAYFQVAVATAESPAASVEFQASPEKEVVQAVFPFLNPMIALIKGNENYNRLMAYFLRPRPPVDAVVVAAPSDGTTAPVAVVAPPDPVVAAAEAAREATRKEVVDLLRSTVTTALGTTIIKFVPPAADTRSDADMTTIEYPRLTALEHVLGEELDGYAEVMRAVRLARQTTPPTPVSAALITKHTAEIYKIYEYETKTPAEKARLLLGISLICAALSSTSFFGYTQLSAVPLYQEAEKYLTLALLVCPQVLDEYTRAEFAAHIRGGFCSGMYSEKVLNWFRTHGRTDRQPEGYSTELQRLLPPAWGRVATLRFE